MSSSASYTEVECKTIDGITIRGWLFAVHNQAPGPAIIMSHGFNCIKELSLPEVAERFRARGYNVLIYDARSVGASGGLPRNQIDPLQMAEDLSDIVTFTSALPTVDPRQILLWGMSLGGTVSGCAAAVDPRPRALVMVCPLFSFVRPDRRRATFAHLIRDRISQLRGGSEPLSLAPFDPRGENVAGFGGAGGPGGLEAYGLMRAAAALGIPGFRDRITLQTFHKLALARPIELLDMVDERLAVLVVVPELDDISSPDEQRAAFARLATPRKRLLVVPGGRHLSVMTGNGAEELLDAMDAFFREALGGREGLGGE